MYDSLGQAHALSVTYTNTGTNAWSYSVTVPYYDLNPTPATPLATPPAPVQVASGNVTFNPDGSLLSPTTPPSISIPSPVNGANPMTIKWDLTGPGGSSLLTQTASADATSADSQNGFAAGTVSKFTVLQDGTVQATYTNGQQGAIGQVALANFANADGLSLNGNNSYAPTSASGQAVVGIAGTGGLGTITGGSVEQSNVNVATELSNLIIAQRSYEANAKAITTFDQIEQDTLQMKS